MSHSAERRCQETMKTQSNAIAYLPTPQQEELLRAALLDGAAASEAWRSWSKTGDLDHLDAGSHRLLPLLLKNLQRLGIEVPEAGKLKGVYRLTHYRNRLLLHHVSAAMRALRSAGMDLLVLKGAAMLAQGYYDLGERPMTDFDVLVREARAMEAVEALQSLGWQPETKAIEKTIQYRHAAGFHNVMGLGLDLHWHVLAHRKAGQIDGEFWNRAKASELDGLPVQVLDSTDQLVHICVHGARYALVPSIRWVADCVALMRHDEDRLDWDRLAGFASQYALSLPLSDTLAYLRNTFSLQIPVQTVQALKAMPVDKQSRHEYRALGKPNVAFDNLISYWFGFRRSQVGPLRVGDYLEFPGYLKVAWGKQSTSAVAWHLAVWPFRHFSAKFKEAMLRFPVLGPIYSRFRALRSRQGTK